MPGQNWVLFTSPGFTEQEVGRHGPLLCFARNSDSYTCSGISEERLKTGYLVTAKRPRVAVARTFVLWPSGRRIGTAVLPPLAAARSFASAPDVSVLADAGGVSGGGVFVSFVDPGVRYHRPVADGWHYKTPAAMPARKSMGQ